MAGLQLTDAEKIAITRKRLGETQEAFAARFNVQALAVTEWEGGKTIPRNAQHRAMLTQLFQRVLHEEDESQFETVAYQLNLPFDEPVRIDFRVSPLDKGRARLGVQIMRKAG
ncbi:MAG: helix-turn-helix domain-containing protein [Terracidiphilus sp.]